MSDSTSELSILIDIRAKLEALAQTSKGLRTLAEDAKKAHDETNTLGTLFREGLGIGSGMEIARRAVSLFVGVVRESIGEAKRMAGEIRDGSEALQISGESYQVFQIELAKANVGMDRLSMAISTQTQHLAQVRAGAAEAANSYRTLGLNAAEMEALSPDQRVLKVAEAMSKATDYTKAFAAAGQILGTRQLPQLLSGLRDLASDYRGAADAAKASGLVMTDSTAAALDAAEKNIEKLRRKVTIGTGEALGGANLLLNSFKKEFWGTLGDSIMAIVEIGTPWRRQAGNLASRIVRNNLTYSDYKDVNKPSPKGNGEEAARQESLRFQLRQAQLELTHVQAAAGVSEKNATESDADKAVRKQALLKMEIAALRQVLELTEQVQAFDDKTGVEEKAAVLVKQTADLTAALNTQAELEGKGANFANDRLETSLALLELRKDFVRLANDSDPLGNEVTLRERLLPILRAQGELYAQMAKAQFPDSDALVAKQEAGTIKPDELQRLNAYVVLLQRKNALIKEEPTLRENRSFELLAKPHAQRTDEEFGRFQKGRNEAGEQRLGAGEGIKAGAQQWVMSLGTQGEQVAAALQSTLGATVQSIGDGIYGWATGTQSLGETIRQLESTVFRTMLNTIVQMGTQWVVTFAIQRAGMIANALLGTALRTKESAEEKGSIAILAIKAGFKALGQLGPIYGTLAFVAALAGIYALTKGFAGGGYTGDGAVDDPAGIVHAGEVVWSQADIARAGGVSQVESMRLGGGAASLENLPIPAPARMRPVNAPPPVAASGSFGGGSGGAAPAKPQVVIALAKNMNEVRELQRQPGWEDAIVDVVQRRRGEILG